MPISLAVSKLLSLLIYPVTHVVLLLVGALAAALAGRRRWATGLTMLCLAWFYLASSGLAGGVLMEWLEADYPPVSAREMPRADAIVLLGGGVGSRRPGADLANLNRWSDRLLLAAALYREGRAPVIVVTGGAPEGQPPEAELTADILAVMGVPREALVLENASRTTRDNARHTLPLLRERGWQSALLVTSAFHMRRAQALFSAPDIVIVPAPTDHYTGYPGGSPLPWLPTITGLISTHYALHEIAGYAVYAARGWL